MRTVRHLLLGLSLPLFACGGGVSVAGRGSSTLTVNADVNAQNQVANASNASDFATDIEVRVSKGGQGLSGATVEIDSDGGHLVLTERQVGSGNYGGSQSGYFRTYTLNIHSGADYLEEVALSGPEAHSFSAPILGAQAMAGMPLEVKWSPSGAATADISTRELDHLAISDTGSYTLPVGSLKKPDPGKTEDERVRVTRSESLVPNGIVGASSLSVSVRNEVTILVVN